MTGPRIEAHELRCRACGAGYDAQALAICENCIGPLEPVYDDKRARPDRATIARRPPSLWRYREWLPLDGEPVYSTETGFTPLIEKSCETIREPGASFSNWGISFTFRLGSR